MGIPARRQGKHRDLAIWNELTNSEVMVDLREWATAQGLEPLTQHRCLLWALVEALPLAEFADPSLASRIRTMLESADRVLEQALLQALPDDLYSPGITATFASPLRGSANPRCPAQHCPHPETVEADLFVIVGRDEEFRDHPIELPQRPALLRGPGGDC